MNFPVRRADNYESIEGTITNNTVNTVINFGSIVNAFYIKVSNDATTATNTLKIKMVSGGADITVRGGESITMNGVCFKQMWMTNKSGASIGYRVLLIGK